MIYTICHFVLTAGLIGLWTWERVQRAEAVDRLIAQRDATERILKAAGILP